MNSNRMPRYAVLVRWGAFRLDLIGRIQIVAAVTVLAAIVGLKLFIF
jgi:hypothetical protein